MSSKRRRIVSQDSESEGEEDVQEGHIAGFRVNDVLNEDMDEDEENNEDDDIEGEDLDDHLETDYREMGELDQYDQADLDQNEYDELAPHQRTEVERKLARRDRLQSKSKRTGVPRSLMLNDDEDDEHANDDDDDEEEEVVEDDGFFRKPGPFRNVYEGEDRIELDLDNFDGPLEVFLLRDGAKYEVIERMAKFLHTFPGYPARVSEMCTRNTQSLHLSFIHLSEAQPRIAIFLAEHPRIILPYFDLAASRVSNEKFPGYYKIHSQIHVRITHLPSSESLRDLRCVHLNRFLKVSGVITRRTAVLPQMKEIIFRCVNCDAFTEPQLLSTTTKSKKSTPLAPSLCLDCASRGSMRFDSERTIYGNFQRVTLQESPGTVPAGRVPRQKDLVFLDDLIDSARPGEEIEVTGVFVSHVDRGLNATNKFPVFSTLIEANFVQKKEDLISSLRITDAEKKQLKKIAADPKIVSRICRSIAPSIYGNDKVKVALALAMFGGREKNIDDKHRIRGDINVLLLGDPGTAKSQCLKYVEKTAPRAVFTTGKGASAVGLTASVHKDVVSGEWTLEGGALVLADRGVCLIDEFDKMNSKDRTSIHEAMEQQQISIAKAGIVTTLQARCSVVAAANPIGGRYDSQRSFTENVELTDPIIQRFDILCVLQDLVHQENDERLAKFVVASHVRSHPDADTVINIFDDPLDSSSPNSDLLDQDLLRKYIIFSKSIKPRLNPSILDQDKIVDVYVQLRKHSGGDGNPGGVPIGVRHCESIIRMAEAFARMHLRDYVQMDDFDSAIGVMVSSFIEAQRFSVRRLLTRSFSKFLSVKKDSDELLMFLLNEVVMQHRMGGDGHEPFTMFIAEFALRAKELSCDRFVSDFLKSRRFLNDGFYVEGNTIVKN